MPLLNSFALMFSGVLIVSSIILSRIGFERSALSNTSASVFAGVGAGVGSGFFIYFGVSDGDLFGSIFVGLISAIVIGLTVFVMHQRLKRQ